MNTASYYDGQGAARDTTLDRDDPALRGKLETPEALGRYLLAGRAVVTICSKRSGERVTLKLGRKREDAGQPAGYGGRPLYFRAVYGPRLREDNYLGCLNAGGGFSEARSASNHPQQLRAARWLAKHVNAFCAGDPAQLSTVLQQAEVWHEGSCGRCGRRLTVPASIASGFGPECAGRMT